MSWFRVQSPIIFTHTDAMHKSHQINPPYTIHLDTFFFSCLRILHDAHLGWPQHTSIKLEALLLRMETATILLVRLRRLENSLVYIRVELLAALARIKSLESMLLQRADQDRVGHLNTVVQGNQV